MTGRINIPNSSFYLPFYLDAGGGAVPFTWQVYAGVAYKTVTWLDVSVGYRYLAFDGGSKTKGVEKLNLGGGILPATSGSNFSAIRKPKRTSGLKTGFWNGPFGGQGSQLILRRGDTLSKSDGYHCGG